MVLVDLEGKLRSITVRKKIGEPNQYGLAFFGKSRYGYFSNEAGVYTIKRAAGPFAVSKEKFYYTHNPRTEPQQDWRSHFAQGVAAWQALTSEQKAEYTKNGTGYRLPGYNYFLRQWLRYNRPE